MKTIVYFSLLALLCASCDKAEKLDADGGPDRTVTIAYLKTLCTQESVRITQDIAIRGVVTANDLYGEFDKTLVIEDATGGISIAADHSALADDYPLYADITVYCNSLTVTDYGGKIELGTTPEGYGAGRIPQADLNRFLHRGTGGKPMRPTVIEFSKVASDHIDTYVRFDGVHFISQGTWCITHPMTGEPVTTEHTIADRQGRTFIVRVAATCNYAKEPIPVGTGSLCGIIDYFNGKYSLRIINREVEFRASATHPKAYLSAWECSTPLPKR